MEVILNNDKLYEKSSPVMEDEFEAVVKDANKMIEICKKNNQGLGLTAVQVGIMKTFFVAKILGRWEICINPKINFYGKKENSNEGCLSFPDRSPIRKLRSRKIQAEWTTPENKVVVKNLKKIDAVVFQHEYDHTVGVCCYPKVD